jgi:hypothetical protein
MAFLKQPILVFLKANLRSMFLQKVIEFGQGYGQA